MIIQDNLSPEKHRIFGDTFRMLKNIWMVFHLIDKKMRKIITTMIRPKLEHAEIIWK